MCDRLLAEGLSVLALDNLLTGMERNLEHLRGHPGFEFRLQDVTLPFDIDGGVDFVLHMASPASPRDYMMYPIETLDVGSLGTRQMLELAQRKDAKFLLTSTSETYGDPAVHPQVETYWGNVNPVGPRSCYDESKRFAEALTMAYHRNRGVKTSIARIFNTYGPRMKLNDGRVVPAFMDQALKGEPITIFGDGSQTRSFCYVDDLIEGFIRMMATGDEVTGPINLGNPGEFTIRQLAEQVIAETGAKSKLIFKPLPQDDPLQRQPNITLARQHLGWEPKIPLKDGLKRTIAYFDDLLRRMKVEAKS
jgi:dTDP-glucose 4,6-dehydratase